MKRFRRMYDEKILILTYCRRQIKISTHVLWEDVYTHMYSQKDFVLWEDVYTHMYSEKILTYCRRQIVCTISTEWRRLIGCLIFRGHFPHKSPIISGSFAKSDLQLKASYVSSPLCTVYCMWSVFHQILQSQSNKSLFIGAWQTRRRKLDKWLRLERRNDSPTAICSTIRHYAYMWINSRSWRQLLWVWHMYIYMFCLGEMTHPMRSKCAYRQMKKSH